MKLFIGIDMKNIFEVGEVFVIGYCEDFDYVFENKVI